MAELDPVTQEFIAQTEPYITGIEAAIAATDSFRESVDAALISVEALHAALDDLPDGKTIHVNVETSGMPAAAAAGAGLGDAGGVREAANAANDADAAFARLDELLKENSGDWEEVNLSAGRAAEGVGEADAAFRALEPDMGAAALASVEVGRAVRDAGTAAQDSGNAARQATWGWRILTNDVTLWAGAFGNTALLGSVKLWHIALDGLFESAVALGEALAALTVGLAAMAPAAQDIYTHLESVQSVNSALGSSIPPLTGKFQALGQAMASQTVEAYGGALNLVNQNGTTLAHVAQEVVTGLDDWIAKLDIWKASQSSMGGMLQNGVGFLHQFEEVVNNVGQAINNLIRADPGTAHYLMDLVVGFSKLLEVVTSIPAPILTAALALHSIDLWGGLAVSKVVQLGTAFIGFGQSLAGAGVGLVQFLNQLGVFGRVGQEAVIPLNDLRTAEAGAAVESSSLAARFAALATNPFVWVAAAAAAIGYLAWQSMQASAAAKALTENLDKGVASAAPSQAIMLIANDVGVLNAKMTETSHGATQMADAMGKNRYSIAAVNETMHQASNDTNMYQNEINKLTAVQRNLFDETGHLIGQGYTYSQSLALMDLAGVKTGDSLQLMRQKVDNLITGYQNLGVQGGMLANAVSAVSFAAELQRSKIQQLTQGYTTFLGVVTGGESAFVAAQQGIAGLGTAASGTGPKIGSLSQSGLQLTSTWQQAVTNGGNLINSLLTQSAAAGMGAKGYNLVSGAAKDYLQQLLPMARGNQLATSELYALAQTAGYQGVNSFTALSQWIGHTSNASQDLQGKVTALTTASAGLTADMNNLANAISGNLNQAMAAAIAQANGGQQAFNNFANAAVHAHGTTDGMTSSAATLANELIKTTGDTNSAHRMFDTFSISLHLSKSQADQLWSAATRTAGGLNTAGGAANRTAGNMNTNRNAMFGATSQAWALSGALNSLHDKTIHVTTAFNTVGSNLFPGAASVNRLFVGATGGRVPGYGGGDIHPALLEGGESVVPKELTPAVAPFLKSHGVPGFEGGGIMSSGGGPGNFGGGGGYSGPSRIVLEVNGRKLAEAMMPDLVGATNRYSRRQTGVSTGILRP